MSPRVEVSDAAFARSRADVYGLFAAVFDGDIETLSDALDAGAFTRLESTLPSDIDCGPLRNEFDDDALAFAYDNLFVVPGDHYVPPFASAHDADPAASFESPSAYHDAGTAGEFLGPPAANLSKLYAQSCFEPSRGDAIPDHVAAIFEFQEALCRSEAERRDDGVAPSDVVSLQRSVHASLAWLDEFDAALHEHDSETGLFATLSRLARTFVAWDATIASDDIETVQSRDPSSDLPDDTTPTNHATNAMQQAPTSTDDER